MSKHVVALARCAGAVGVAHRTEFERPGGVEFVPELLHNQSGVGSGVYPVDLNKDGRLDIITATRFGTFVFFGQPRGAAPKSEK
jgi:hypothetical protein